MQCHHESGFRPESGKILPSCGIQKPSLRKTRLAHCRWVTFREEERLLPSDRNSTLMAQNLSRIRSEALIGRRSSFIIFAIVYEWQTKDKRPQRRNERRWISDKIVNIWVFWSSFAEEHNTLPKSTRRNVNIEKICIWNPMTTGFIL